VNDIYYTACFISNEYLDDYVTKDLNAMFCIPGVLAIKAAIADPEGFAADKIAHYGSDDSLVSTITIVIQPGGLDVTIEA
jgi:hypothetical protein